MITENELNNSIDSMQIELEKKDLYSKIFSEFYPIEYEFCLNIIENSKDNDVVKNNTLLYPGGYMDIEHTLLFGAKTNMLIDPAYTIRSINDIQKKFYSLGFETSIKEFDTSHRIRLNTEDSIDFYFMPQDATEWLYKPVIKNEHIGTFILKNPNTIYESDIPSLYNLGENHYRTKNIDDLMKGGLYFEAGIRNKMPKILDKLLNKKATGHTSCWVFGRDDDTSIYQSNLWAKK